MCDGLIFIMICKTSGGVYVGEAVMYRFMGLLLCKQGTQPLNKPKHPRQYTCIIYVYRRRVHLAAVCSSILNAAAEKAHHYREDGRAEAAVLNP